MSPTLLLAGDTSAGHGEENHEETQRLPSCLQFHFADNLNEQKRSKCNGDRNKKGAA